MIGRGIIKHPFVLFTFLLLLAFAVAVFLLVYTYVDALQTLVIPLISPTVAWMLGLGFMTILVVLGYFLFRRNRGLQILLAYVTIVEILFATVVLCLVTIHENNQVVERMVRQAAHNLQSELNLRVQFRILTLSGVVKRWEVGAHDEKAWQRDSQEMFEHAGGYQSIVWMSTLKNIKWHLPKDQSLTLADKAVYENEYKKAFAAIQKKELVYISGSIILSQVGKGFLIYVPSYSNGKFDGFIVGAVAYQAFFRKLISENFHENAIITLSDEGKDIYQHGDFSKQPQWKGQFLLSINRHIRLVVRIGSSQSLITTERSLLPWIILVIGTLSALIVVLLTFFTSMVQRHAKQVDEVNQSLTKEIEERKAAEEAKAMLKQALLQSQKMEAIGTLAGGVAHNFNNILYSIGGYTTMAREDVPKNSLVYDNLGKVQKALSRGQELVASILSFSRRQSYEFTLIEVKKVVDDAVALLRPTLPATVELTEEMHLQSELVYGNHTQLEQVIMNIVSNAVDAMARSGKIVISAEMTKITLQLRMAYPQLAQASRAVIIAITDNGPGMDEKVRERVFEPFYTTKDVGKGTGLGLATAHAIVHDHQGEIIIESEKGKGATFKIVLPLYIANQE